MFDNIRRDFEIYGRPLSNGGFWTLFVYRFGVWSMKRRFPPFRWLLSAIYLPLNKIVEVITGVVLDRHTKIGRDFHIIHTGLLQIHPRVVIGDRCGIMHGVTLGTNMDRRVPVIGDDVFIGCHSSILGGITVGDGARIAANTLVIGDVPPGAVAMGVPAKIYPNMDRLRKNKSKEKPKS